MLGLTQGVHSLYSWVGISKEHLRFIDYEWGQIHIFS